MMNMLQSLRRTLPALGAATLLTLTPHLGAAILPAEKLLPDDTLIVVSTPDFALMREFYRTSTQTRLWASALPSPSRR